MKRRHFFAGLGTLPAGSMIVAAQPPPTIRRLTTDIVVIGGDMAGTIRCDPGRKAWREDGPDRGRQPDGGGGQPHWPHVTR